MVLQLAKQAASLMKVGGFVAFGAPGGIQLSKKNTAKGADI